MDDLIRKIKKFRHDRDWDQYHSPKNLVMALVVALAVVMVVDMGVVLVMVLCVVSGLALVMVLGWLCYWSW